MSGFILHPGHHELHGVTVVLETAGPLTYLGRFDTEDERGVHLLNVAVHDAATNDTTLDEFLARAHRFGVRAERKHVLVPAAEVSRVRRLGEFQPR
jgi:hypothetical protein